MHDSPKIQNTILPLYKDTIFLKKIIKLVDSVLKLYPSPTERPQLVTSAHHITSHGSICKTLFQHRTIITGNVWVQTYTTSRMHVMNAKYIGHTRKFPIITLFSWVMRRTLLIFTTLVLCLSVLAKQNIYIFAIDSLTKWMKAHTISHLHASTAANSKLIRLLFGMTVFSVSKPIWY